MSKLKHGDTLIEVMIAFAILSLVMVSAFSAAVSGYTASLAARERTIGAFLLQYQTEALRAYRNSLDWSSTGTASFLQGFSTGAGGILPAMSTVTNFCMERKDRVVASTTINYWSVNENTGPLNCDTVAKAVAPQLNQPQVRITRVSPNPYPSSPTIPNQIVYEVAVSWLPSNSTLREESKARVVLTEK